MPNWPKQTPVDMNAFYGNPDRNRDGRCDPDWESNHIVKITPPYQLYYPMETSKGKLVKRGKKWQTLRVHRKCADSLLQCLTEIKNTFSEEEIKKYELDLCGGVHVFRLKRSGRSLSIHSWGAAIDLSHLINYYGRRYDEKAGMMPKKAADFFQKRGWAWLQSNDAMHFQAARL